MASEANCYASSILQDEVLGSRFWVLGFCRAGLLLYPVPLFAAGTQCRPESHPSKPKTLNLIQLRLVEDRAHLVVAAVEEERQVAYEDVGDALVLARGVGRAVRRDQRVRQVPQRRIGRQRFLLKDVERGEADPAVANPRDHLLLVNHRASPDVDEPDTRLHRVEFT